MALTQERTPPTTARSATTPRRSPSSVSALLGALADGGPGAAAADGGRHGRALRRDPGPRAGPVVVVGVHGAPAGLAVPPGPARSSRRCWRRGGSRTRPRGWPGARSAASPGMVEGDARRRIAEEQGPTHVAERRGPAEHRPARLHRGPQVGPRGDAPRDLPAGPAAGDPAHPGAPRESPGPLDFRRTVRASISTGGVPLVPPTSPKAAPHRARRALRRERVGRELRAVHAVAGLRAARPVPEPAGLHLHRPRPRGHRPLHAGVPTSPT